MWPRWRSSPAGARLPITELLVRALQATDAETYRALRLFMLEESPTAFSSDLETARSRSLSHFRERATDTAENFIMGAFADDRLIGCAGGVREQELKRRHIALLWGMYVRPEHRRTGVGRQLVAAVLDRLRELPGLEIVQLGVTAGNEPAVALYEAFGFEAYGREPAAIRVAGSDYDELLMSLRL